MLKGTELDVATSLTVRPTCTSAVTFVNNNLSYCVFSPLFITPIAPMRRCVGEFEHKWENVWLENSIVVS